MDHRDRTVELYTVQTEQVIEIINQSGCYYVKKRFVAKKYGEVKDVFLNAYSWYTRQAAVIVQKPDEAESAVWTFLNNKYVEKHQGAAILRLKVPIEKAVYFRMSDWNKILNLRYLGNDVEEEHAFTKKLAQQGIRYEGDVYNLPYYPQLKKQLVNSWQRLFRYDQQIKHDGTVRFEDMQAGLWCIKKEWVV